VQLGLFAPDEVSQAAPEALVPGHVVATCNDAVGITLGEDAMT
jgi:hypothetical protein